jgi:outer membrane lipoprotein-sorting protein
MTLLWRTSLLALACGLNAPDHAAAEAESAMDVPRLMAMMAEVASRQDRFTETKKVEYLTKPLTMTGTLSYTRPDHIEKHVLTPYEDHLIVEGDELTLRNKNGTKRLNVKSHPMIWSFVEAIRASLAGDASLLRRFYHVKIEGTERNWTLTLRPLDQQAASYVNSIALHGTKSRLTRVDIVETGGDQSIMTIHEPTS